MPTTSLLYHPDFFAHLSTLPQPLRQRLARGSFAKSNIARMPGEIPDAPRYSFLWRWAASSLGQTPTFPHPAVAALRLQSWGQSIPSNVPLLAADLMHLHPDLNRLRLLLPSGLDGVSNEEAAAFAQVCSPVLQSHGLTLIAQRGRYWVLALEPGSPLAQHTRAADFTDPFQAQGMSLQDALPQGEMGLIWRRISTELQIELHNATLNSTRMQQGRLPFNGLWLWGLSGIEQADLLQALDMPSSAALTDQAGALADAEPWVGRLLATIRVTGVDLHWARLDDLSGQLEECMQGRSRVGLLNDMRYWRWDRTDVWKLWRRRNLLRAPWHSTALDAA